MIKLHKVKKSISTIDESNLVQWKYRLINLDTWEILEPEIKTSKYKLKLSNNKQFMKKTIYRKLNMEVTKKLREVDLWFLYKILNYIDEDNIINFKRIKLDYNYSDSKLSKCKKPLFENDIIKDKDGFIYLSPLVWIRTKEINQELIKLFKESFEKYGIELNY